MREIVIISGKGGTGKTSLTASFAALAEHPVMVDCDVDAADLHLVLKPDVQETQSFSGGKVARIQSDCLNCGYCQSLCRFGAIQAGPVINASACEGCGVCAHFCPHQAIAMEEALNGQWFRSETRLGPMFHARLGIAEENSGKLVTLIRKEARTFAQDHQQELLLVDGPPGIGCPVIASLTGATRVVIVTEPTVSGIHDMMRVVELARHFQLPASIVVNKADLNLAKVGEITAFVQKEGLELLGNIPYDPAITQAQLVGKSVVEVSDGQASQSIRSIWKRLEENS